MISYNQRLFTIQERVFKIKREHSQSMIKRGRRTEQAINRLEEAINMTKGY